MAYSTVGVCLRFRLTNVSLFVWETEHLKLKHGFYLSTFYFTVTVTCHDVDNSGTHGHSLH